MDQSDTFPWSRYGIGCPGCWGLRVNPEYLPGFRKELRSYEWHDVFTCQIWTTWRPNRCGSIGTCQWPVTSFWLLLEQPLRNHALLPASVETAGRKSSWFDDSTGPPPRLDLLIFIITVTIAISTFIICHPSQSLYTPTKHKTKNRCWRNPTPTPAESAPNKNHAIACKQEALQWKQRPTGVRKAWAWSFSWSTRSKALGQQTFHQNKYMRKKRYESTCDASKNPTKKSVTQKPEANRILPGVGFGGYAVL